MEPVLEVPQLPKDIWQRIAKCMNNDTDDWKGAAAISSLCRATRGIQHDNETIYPDSLSELIWLVKHKPPHTHMALCLGGIWDMPSDPPSDFSQKLMDAFHLNVAPCLRNMRELHVLFVKWEDDFLAWLSSIMLSGDRLEVVSLEIDRFEMLPTVRQINHLNIVVVEEIAATCSRSLQCLVQLETLRLAGQEYHQLRKSGRMRIDALNLRHSRHLHALSLAFIMPGGLTVPGACAVKFEGDAAELRRCWEIVRPLCSSCVVTSESEADIDVAFLIGQACERLTILHLNCYKCVVCAPPAQHLGLGANLRSLQLLTITCFPAHDIRSMLEPEMAAAESGAGH